MVMVYIPKELLNMGSPETDVTASGNEKPQHQVCLDAFWIDTTEVTNNMFAKFNYNGYKTEAEKEPSRGWVYNSDINSAYGTQMQLGSTHKVQAAALMTLEITRLYR